MPRGKPMRARNGYGSVVKLSGKRRQPYEVRVNTRMDERYYPVYDVLGRYETREAAMIALADFNKEPYRISDRNITFSALYELFYKDKYEESGRIYSQSTKNCTKSAYKYCTLLYDLPYRDLRTPDFKSVLSQEGKKGYSSFDAGTFQGGIKTEASKNRIVPIHSKIHGFVEHRLSMNNVILFALNDLPIGTQAYTRLFKKTLTSIGITTYHTPHDCRHTFISLLDSAGANQVCIDRLVGHASKTITTRTYTHKTIEELREAIEMI